MQFFWHIVALTCMSIPNIFGFNLIFGKGKIFHFGPLGLSIIAAYTVFVPVVLNGWNYPAAILFGTVCTLAVCAFFAWLSLRLPPDSFGVMSLALHLGMLAVVMNWSSVTRGALGIPRVPRFPFLETSMDFVIVSFIIAAVWIGFLLWLCRSPFGRKLDALAEHMWYGKALGINMGHVHLIAFCIGGVGALLTNVLFRQYLFLVHPSDFGYHHLIFFIMVVVAGNPGSVLGVLLSLIVLTTIREGIRFLPLSPDVLGPLRLILFGIILFVSVYWRRDVLFPKPRTI